MNKRILLPVLIIFILLSVFAVAFYLFKKNNTIKGVGDTKNICFEKKCFLVELAKNQKEIERGLMFRESLEDNRGMLFIFQREGNYSFWMKNTLIPLDIIWINEEKNIVFINKNTQPCEEEACPSVNPGTEARYVLELNGGISEKMGLSVGDSATFK
jgi:uncharacterized protein